MRVTTTTPKLAAAAAAGTLLLGSAAAVAATSAGSAASTGTVHIWVSPSNTAVQKILVTGAIGDSGTATSVTKSGKVDKNGKYVHIVLKHGTFRVNAVAFNNRANNVTPTINTKTCSAWATITGPVTLYGGTGDYADISGKVDIATSFAALFPRLTSGPDKGQCNLGNNTQPTHEFDGEITGSGKVTFGG
jgi:hypothetical protein